jgi:hypothetical protein
MDHYWCDAALYYFGPIQKKLGQKASKKASDSKVNIATLPFAYKAKSLRNEA